MFGAARAALGGVKFPSRCVVPSRARLPLRVRAFASRGPRPAPTFARGPRGVLAPRASTSFSDDIRGYNFSDDASPGSGSGASPDADASAPRATVSVPKLVALLLDLNVEGQGIIRDVVARGDLGTRDKGGRDDVTGEYVVDAQTEADRRVEAHVLRALRAFCPALPVVAEESYENATANDPSVSSSASAAEPYPVAPFAPEGEVIPRTPHARLALGSTLDWPPHLREPVDPARVVVFVDPLDGTNEFAAGRREPVTCLMGVAVDGSPVAGIIGQPFARGPGDEMGRVVWGGRGLGVHGVRVDDEDGYGYGSGSGSGSGRARSRVGPSPPAAPVACVNRVTRDERIDAVLAATACVVGHKVSATGFHFLMVLEGRAHCAMLLREGTKKWDSCAGEAILRAAGGAVSDAVGRRYRYDPDPATALNLCGIIVSADRAFHRRLTAKVRETISSSGRWPYDVPDASVRPPVLPPAPPGGWRALTVDVGGCLLTPKETVGDTYLRLARAHGFGPEVTRASVKAAIRAGFAAPPPPGHPPGVRYVGDGKSFWRPLVAAAMGGLAMDDPRLEPVLNDLYAHYENPDAWHVAPGAPEALAALREGGVRVAVVSNWDERLPKLLRDCGFDERALDAVVVSAEVLSDKPDGRIFDVALRRLGMSSEEAGAAVHVGDSVVNDVEGARAAGFGSALLWSSKNEEGCAFDFAELAEEILATREGGDGGW